MGTAAASLKQREEHKGFMWYELKEKRLRDMYAEDKRTRDQNRTILKALRDSWDIFVMLGSSIFLLVSGISLAFSSWIGAILIISSIVIFTVFLNRAFSRELWRGIQVVSLLLIGSLGMYLIDWIIYPVRRYSNWKILSTGEHAGEMTFAQMGGQHEPKGMNWMGLNIYGPREKPKYPRRLMLVFHRLGPAFIKLGQIISMLVVIPQSWISEFAKLCDYLPAQDFKTVKAIVEDELGRDLEEVYEYFEPEPLGAASLAQAHCAVLRQEQKDVVVKVQRRGLKPLFVRDYKVMDPIGTTVQLILWPLSIIVRAAREINMPNIIREYGEVTVGDELNFGLEATVLQMYTNANDRMGLLKDLHSPHVYWAYTTEAVLTMEREWLMFKLVDIDVGEPKDIWAFLSFLKGLGYDSSLALKRCHRAWWYPYARYGVLNMDVHHGNFLYRYDDTIAMVDFGINFYSGYDYKELCKWLTIEFWGAVMKGDFAGVLDAIKKIGLIEGLDEDECYEKMTSGVDQLLTPVINISDVMGEGSTGGFITDVNAALKSPSFIMKTFLDPLQVILTNVAGVRGDMLGYDIVGLLRMIPYWATWMQIVDPTWNLFTEGDSLNAYWFGDYDGTIPYMNIDPPVFPSPKLPYEPEFIHEPRSVKIRRVDDLGLCFEAPHTSPKII
ncbi:MAG: AarF/UbiB family protein [Chloroflexota bacterium]|nr:AarF/UbiB family protein [Chloroflexota bacterium]